MDTKEFGRAVAALRKGYLSEGERAESMESVEEALLQAASDTERAAAVAQAMDLLGDKSTLDAKNTLSFFKSCCATKDRMPAGVEKYKGTKYVNTRGGMLLATDGYMLCFGTIPKGVEDSQELRGGKWKDTSGFPASALDIIKNFGTGVAGTRCVLVAPGWRGVGSGTRSDLLLIPKDPQDGAPRKMTQGAYNLERIRNLPGWDGTVRVMEDPDAPLYAESGDGAIKILAMPIKTDGGSE